MIDEGEWDAYEGREHSYIKHAVLKAYLQRFIMILGKQFGRIAYVDGFAGPWQSKSLERRDSSAGISLKAIGDCRKMLHTMYPTKTQVRGLFIERDSVRASELEQLAEGDKNVEVWNADFTTSIDRIIGWLEPDEFAFVFVDPCGWKGIVESSVLAPLLRRPKTELLINFMWNFINLATGLEDQRMNLARVFGDDFEEAIRTRSEPKQIELMKRYRRQLSEACIGGDALPLRTALLPVEYFRRTSVIFYLVYVTHNATGLLTFAEEAEKVERQQAHLKIRHRVLTQSNATGQNDMFVNFPSAPPKPLNDSVSELWLSVIPADGTPLVVTGEVMADLLERADCTIGDLQGTLRGLILCGRVRNLSAKRPRPTNAVKWRTSEKLVRIT